MARIAFHENAESATHSSTAKHKVEPQERRKDSPHQRAHAGAPHDVPPRRLVQRHALKRHAVPMVTCGSSKTRTRQTVKL